MDEEGFIPDHQVRTALVRALTVERKVRDRDSVTESPPPLLTAAPTTKTAPMKETLNGNRTKDLVSPTEAWSFEDWQSLKRPNSDIVLRSELDFPGGTYTGSRPFETETMLTRIFLGPSETTVANSVHSAKASPQARNRWSSNILEGNVPNLAWNLSSTTDTTRIYAASKKLIRLVRIGEAMLLGQYPGLQVDINNSTGLRCPSLNCSAGRPLTIGEVYQGWELSPADPNRYTTKCVHCGTDFIPRFSVKCKAENWVGSEGPDTALWCELLSPWALHKEIMNIVFENGVFELLSNGFRSLSHQRSVVFWNMIVAFRLRGLPLTPLLTDGSIVDAYPSKDRADDSKE